MIVVKLQGGLGNQMFQYALAKAMSKLHDSPFELDLEFLLDRTPNKGKDFVFRDYDLNVFSITPDIASTGTARQYASPTFWEKVKAGFKPKTVYQESFFHFDAHALLAAPDVYLEGYWQSPKYFETIEKELREDFRFIHAIEDHSKKLLEQILQTDSICVNVRRADFLTNTYHGVCGMSYFEPAIHHLASSLSNPKVFIFSDDPQWCLDNFKSKFSMEVVDHSHKGFKFSNQLQLMAACKHFIIPNSTFAWWAVWLSNKKESKVIAPTHWFADSAIDTRDLIPDNWMRFNN